MKLVVAFVRPGALERISVRLGASGVQGMTVSEARGFGRQSGRSEVHLGAEDEVTLVPKLRVEVLVPDELAGGAVRAIEEAARTGEVGDGKVMVLPVEEAVRIRTGERGSDAV